MNHDRRGGHVPTHCRTALIAAAGLAVLAARLADAQEEWSYEMVPYLWTTNLDGHIGVGGSAGSIDAGFQELRDFLDVGAALRVTARRPPITWFIEANYLGYKSDSVAASRVAHVEATQTFGEAGLSYDFNSALTLYGGVRAQQIDSVIEVSSGHNEGEQSWLDGIVGMRWTPLASDHWVGWVRGDAGGGGSKLVWLAEAGCSYRWTERWTAYIAYRALDTSYDRSGFIYDMHQSGLLFGFGAQF